MKSQSIDQKISDAFNSISKGISSRSDDIRKQAATEFYHLSEAIEELRPQVEKGVKNFVDRAGEASQVYGRQARDIASHRKEQLEGQFRERPWTFIAAGVVIGIILTSMRSKND